MSFGRSTAKRPKVLVVSGAFTFGSSFDQELDDIKVSVLDGSEERSAAQGLFSVRCFSLRFVDEELDDPFGHSVLGCKVDDREASVLSRVDVDAFLKKKDTSVLVFVGETGQQETGSSPSSSFWFLISAPFSSQEFHNLCEASLGGCK